MTAQPTADYLCSTLSREAHEPLYGSAPEKRVWLLLQYDQPWGAQAFAESDLAEPVKAHLSASLNAIPDSNILLIRQPGQSREGMRLFVAVVEEAAPCLYAFTLADYADLLDIDLTALAGGDPTFDHQRSEEALFLVCTNARRDKCCARYGVAIYQELRAQVGESAWQCTHLGGHRFAPTALFLPHGICYGRIPQSHVVELVRRDRAGQLDPDYLRGRVCYRGPVQAADALLRQQLSLTSLDDLTWIDSQADGPDTWVMQAAVQGEKRHIRLQKIRTDAQIYTSCFNDKTAFVEDYRLI
ncbi:MAG: hypothetical protein K8J31_20635 [Anaerolineae bacterium]|nr:hypothetical protein [Anaerolineae bacterium]